MADEEKLSKLNKGVWFWQKEWWWAIAIKDLVSRKLEEDPGDSVTITVSEVNAVLDELADSFGKRLKALAVFPPRISFSGPPEIILRQD